MDALRELQRSERAILGRQFVAPVVRGGRVRVDVDGLVWECRVEDPFEGWGIFAIASNRRARLVREAGPGARQAYGRRFRASTMVLCGQDARGRWRALDRASGQLVQVRLVPPTADVFDAVRAVRDGGQAWVLAPDPSATPRRAASMRQALLDASPPASGDGVYALAWRLAHPGLQNSPPSAPQARPSPRDRTSRRLSSALGLAGARLLDYRELGSSELDVSWERDGMRRTTRVRSHDLAVVSSGICLSGRDADFDLTSIVGVMAEAPHQH